MKTMKLVFGVAAALSLVGQGSVSEVVAAESVTNVTVEVLIFSGRPNPTWQLQDLKPLAMLKSKLKDLPEASKHEPAEWSRSGFAGFRIRGGESLGIPGEIRIFQGVIKTGHGKSVRYLKDTTGLEQSLVNESKKQPLESLVKDVISNYERGRKAAP